MEEFFKILTKTVLFFSGSALGGVLGYLLKTQIDHRLAIARNYENLRATEFNKASAAFRSAFVDEIYALRHIVKYGGKDPKNVLIEPAFIKHEKAKIMFEPFLSVSNLEGFNAAWDKYRKCHNDYYEDSHKENPTYVSYPDSNCTYTAKSEYCLKHMNVLLKYAEAERYT